MNKKEFLSELENTLEGRLPEPDIREIISDYGADAGRPAGTSAAESGGRQYTDFQQSINERTNRIFDKVVEPDKSVDIGQLAPMPRRLGAYVIDSILLGAVTLGVLIALSAPFMYTVRNSASELYATSPVGPAAAELVSAGFMPKIAFANTILLVMLLGAFNLFTTIFIWATNGYTPGKWILKMRVVKTDGSKIGFLDALLRELVIKCVANSVLSGFLNIGSFIWGCVTEDHKTVHDLVAKTRVVEWDRAAGNV